jgi:hypothetical protein
MSKRMKTARKLGRSISAAIVWRRWIAAVSSPAIAVACCRAAQRDERNGYTFTAAMEWRKAAQLLAPIPVGAELCWRQWERIMRLPRRLAEPISASAPMAVPVGAFCPFPPMASVHICTALATAA